MPRLPKQYMLPTGTIQIGNAQNCTEIAVSLKYIPAKPGNGARVILGSLAELTGPETSLNSLREGQWS